MPIQPDEIRALTLMQPMASAIIIGPKRIENRTHKLAAIPKGGIWVAIHAGLRDWPTTQDKMVDAGWHDCPPLDELPRGVVIGLAHFTEIRHYDPSSDTQLRGDKWAMGPWCILVDKVNPFPDNHPLRLKLKGKLGLWRLPVHVESMYREMLIEAGHGITPSVDIRHLVT